jgi:tetrapyrrole methylase family protein/MazG family protein
LRAPGAPLLLYQVHDRRAASTVKLALMQAGYPDDFSVTLLRAAGVSKMERVLRDVPLFALDRGEAAAICDHLTSVWVPPLAADARPPGLDGLVRVMARLRDPNGGCPWDREQTHQSLRRYVIEEAYEVAEAIDRAEDDPDKLCDELGDLLLQVVFHAQLAREEGIWDIEDVCQGIVRKLVRRHPHVFGDITVNGADEVLTNWNAIKAAEKGNEDRRSIWTGFRSVFRPCCARWRSASAPSRPASNGRTPGPCWTRWTRSWPSYVPR